MAKRRIQLIVALFVLMISLALLLWGLWPFLRVVKTLVFPAGSLQVP
jgi:uncharacterized membrane protein